ncbi:MAG: hypothetical protein ACR2J8_13110 [Thermomicrobiales bacterium]
MADIKKAGLLGAALIGAVAVDVSAQTLPTQEGIADLVNSMMGNAGSTVGTGSSGGNTTYGGTVTGSGESNIGSSNGLASADASGGNHNVSFVS